MDPDTRALWQRFLAVGDPEAREQLIVVYAPLVKYVAGRVGSGMPQNVDLGDLTSYGMFGLIDAIERFDPGRGAKFETFAIPRIRGAILDELRSLDWVPRSVRSKARTLEETIHRLEAELGRAPTDEEVAGELGISLDDLHRMLDDVAAASVIALDESLPVGDEGESVAVADTVQQSHLIEPEQYLDDAETRRLLVDLVRRLPPREQEVIGYYYLEGLTLSQIGDILGVTESRVCQIHTKAVLGLKGKIAEVTTSD